MSLLLASIPSPSSGSIDVGPLELHAYGVMLLLGILAATWLTGVRWTRRGGDWDLVFRVAMWGVAGGIVGARLYHVVTSWSEVPDPKWQGVFEIWKGGLGVWGGILGGVIAGAIVVRRSGNSIYSLHGRGRARASCSPRRSAAGATTSTRSSSASRPTFPGASRSTSQNRPEKYIAEPTFHPLFLYESLWNLLGVGFLLLVDRRFKIRPPGLFALYVAWYTAFRTYEETLRIDPSHEYFGLRLNFYVSVILFALAIAAFVWSQRRTETSARPRPTAPPQGPKMTVPKGRVRR